MTQKEKNKEKNIKFSLASSFFILNNHFWLNMGLGVGDESGDFSILMIIQTFILVTIL
jgi:hypothetical protein